MPPTTVTLDDKYSARNGRVLIPGIQAIVRMGLEQRRLDTARGLDTRAFVSGYQGSPLAGLDQEMARAGRFLDDAGVVFRPAVNEELAATAVAGTQLLRQAPGRRHDGVTGFTVQVDHAKLDQGVEAFIELRFLGTTRVSEIVRSVSYIPEVAAVFTIAGDPDALVRLRVRDLGHLQQVIDTLRRSGSVTGTRTLMVLGSWERRS